MSSSFISLEPEEGNMSGFEVTTNVQGDLFKVVHGTLTPDGELATLVVVDFRFTGLHPPRRFRNAIITLQFEDPDSIDAEPPEIFEISPHRIFGIDRIEIPRNVHLGGKATGGGYYRPTNLNLAYDWSVVDSRSVLESKSVHGQKILGGIRIIVGRSKPPKYAVKWFLGENSTDSGCHGIPNFLRLPVLLRRKTINKFQAEVDIKVDGDFRYKLEKRAGNNKTDPLKFDPGLGRPSNDELEIDAQNLCQVDLNKLTIFESRSSQSV